MGDINNFVNVVIRLLTGAVSRAGFGVTQIAGFHTAFTDRLKFYGGLDELEDDGFSADGGALLGLVYNAALAAFSARPKPERIAVGRLQVDAIRAKVVDAVAGRDYKVTINGTEFSFTSVDSDPDNIALGIVGDINGGSEPVTAAAIGSNGEYTVTADVAGTPFTLVIGQWQTAEVETDGETWSAGLAAIRDYSDDWYELIITIRTQGIVETVAGWIEALDSPKRFRTASADGNIINVAPGSDTTSIAAVLKALNYDRSFDIYHSKADGSMSDEWIDAAWSAMALGFNPDVETATEKFKTLPGITPDSLTSTQRLNAIGTEDSPTSGKNSNIYTVVAGEAVTQSGIMASGEWADIIFGADWLKVRMEEQIFQLLKRNPKVPYTTDGILTIVGAIRAQLKRGQNTGFLAFDAQQDPTFGYAMEVPAITDIDSADKANRILKGIKFYATVAGAIHAVKPIIGTIQP